ncbi:MAG: response regulator transcription factor [Bacteroidia bacterium]|jgi:two-component system alkaline phosphatase synthesis response regulator PhoP|nr:response regulator transcription factor [Bacteroidia bacterium]
MMNASEAHIVFLDQSPHKILKTIDLLRTQYNNLKVFSEEQEFMSYIEQQVVQVIFLNLDLQPNDGIAVLKEIRTRQFKEIPYVVLYSEKQDDFLQELAFASGADAFISFQLRPMTLKLFLQNLLWRRKIQFPSHEAEDLHIDTERYLIYHKGQPIQLPRKEFQLMELLYTNSGKYFSKPEIADLLWKDNSIANKRIIDVHIYNIRQLFGKNIIHSQKGKGYRLIKTQTT